jgi:hypothetical protein
MRTRAKLAPWQFVALNQPFEHFYMAGGVATGKSFTLAHFAINNIEQWPDLTGMIGANSHDQLSQATLRELFYWLEEYGYDYVVDSRPPKSWEQRRQFKSYKNTLSIRPRSAPKMCATIFTRILSDPNALRGIEFSWYGLDETRDTPMDTHDVIISRMRESRKIRRGLVCSTTNGEDWAYQRFVKNARKGQRMYGSMHVPTRKSVELGIIGQEFYDTLVATYDPLMAQQELDALHVNVKGGRAYYAASDNNRRVKAPWGDEHPDKDRPLIVGCDFNYSPSPCVWEIGQISPEGDAIHWFGEISMKESSTPDMTIALVNRWPGYFYQVYGDSYGNRGTTSNAGQHDYNQMARVFNDAKAVYSIDVDQYNPHIKDRVENMNRLFRNAVGEIKQTYNPYTCPLLDSDVKMVGWKVANLLTGRGKLDDGGNKQLTHGSDAAGYACWKLLPLAGRANIIDSIESSIRMEMGRE